MRHHIDPKVDCVFKALLGDTDNSNLLIHFLNAMLESELESPVYTVEILNPYNAREYLDDKLSIVDVKAKDQQGRQYQIEIQLLTKPHLPARILYTWADLYSHQLHSGDDYKKLCPTYAIWLLAEDLLVNEDDTTHVHDYQLRDSQGRRFLAHGGIWLFELKKFAAQQVATEEQRWLKFFKEAEQLDTTQLPEWMHTEEMQQAMTTLMHFSEKERAYYAYQARQNAIREQHAIQQEIEEAQLAKEEALQQADAEQQRADAEQQRADAEQQRADAEQQRADAEQQRADAEQQRAKNAVQEKEAALAEIASLRALLENK